MSAADRKRLTRQVTTFANQRGVKIVKYFPAVHDQLMEDGGIEDWSGDHLSMDKVDEVLDVYRARDNIDPKSGEDLVARVKLEIFVATAIDEGELVVLGVIGWARYNPIDYQYDDDKAIKTALLKLNNEEFKENTGMTKLALKGLDEAGLSDFVTIDEDFPHFNDFDAKDDIVLEQEDLPHTADILILLTKPDSLQRGIGRMLLAHFVNHASRKFDHLLVNLGKGDVRVDHRTQHIVNKNMVKLATELGFTPIRATFHHPMLPNRPLPFHMLPREDAVYMVRSDRAVTKVEMENFLALDRRDLGNFVCSRKTNGYKYATNGAKYVVPGEEWDEKCGANKGWSNPYAGNYQ